MNTTGHRPLVAVLGASGFVGSAVTRELARRPIRLRTVARRPVGPLPAGAAAEHEPLVADLTGPGALAAAVAGADAVIHLVAHISGQASWRVADGDAAAERVNAGLARDLVAAVRAERPQGPPPTVLFAGTTMQAGVPAAERIDGTERDAPTTAYPRHKLAAERALMDATAQGVLRAVSLRLPTVFGHVPGAADRGVVSAMIRRALAGEPLTMWHDGSVRRDLLHVEDAARAFAAALDHAEPLAGRHWLVGTGSGTRLRDVFREVSGAVAELTGRPAVPLVSVPPPPHADANDFHGVVVDSSMFRGITGWRPRVPLRDGLLRAAAAIATAPV
ncbi:NAD-dependent epimerase/dehydratase family protein [Marinitenerispora sediminis]|uniref:NAD-dependent epimerase/dehydratase n=1 Tax=Marinitenerispora sediminis TaxID=1931232 RepID=A0A368T470_9ACTN|nr:NAD-dependent epimerase/dehydratase [Marinitenerispora sediminis]RCV52884.1 NAD-dependent epimerase/dehydratase [Marinitenerispora sediminis]